MNPKNIVVLFFEVVVVLFLMACSPLLGLIAIIILFCGNLSFGPKSQ